HHRIEDEGSGQDGLLPEIDLRVGRVLQRDVIRSRLDVVEGEIALRVGEAPTQLALRARGGERHLDATVVVFTEAADVSSDRGRRRRELRRHEGPRGTVGATDDLATVGLRVDDARLLLRLGAGSEPERGEEAEAPDGRREERGGLAL